MFPPHQQRHVRLQLSNVLKGVVSQRLIPRIEGKGRVAAVEVMISTARIRDLIDDREKTVQLKDAIAQGYTTYGMQTFDQALMELVKRKVISYEEALRQSSNPDDFKLKFSGIDSTSDTSWSDFERGKDQEVKDLQELKEEDDNLDADGQVKLERF
jgi:twitching motility protein PilT